MEKLQMIIMCLSLFINVCTVIGLIYTFYKFANKPREDLETRVTECEIKIKEHDTSLKQGNDKFREQKEKNEMIFSVLLAFVDFEIAYCHHTGYEHDKDLLKAKDKLEVYLSSR